MKKKIMTINILEEKAPSEGTRYRVLLTNEDYKKEFLGHYDTVREALLDLHEAIFSLSS